MNDWRQLIEAYVPQDEREAVSKQVFLQAIAQAGDQVLTRDNLTAHITSSAFIMNPALDKVLMIHHNIMQKWAWAGGHADGDGDLLAVSIREAQEETGVETVKPLSTEIAAMDVLNVERHIRRGVFVSSHVHLSVAYILICNEDVPLRIKPDENSGVHWINLADIAEPAFSPHDVYLYQKLAKRAHQLKNTPHEGSPEGAALWRDS